MAKFFGEVGYGYQTETKPGVWEDVVVERRKRGCRTAGEGNKAVNCQAALEDVIPFLLRVSYCRRNCESCDIPGRGFLDRRLD